MRAGFALANTNPDPGVRLYGFAGRDLKQFPTGLTFPLGYTNGHGACLPTSDILHEGGYEVESYHEYWLPAQLGPGFEDILAAALRRFADQGVR